MKKLFLIAILMIPLLGFTQNSQYHLSTHILDLSSGMPAFNVDVKLEKQDSSSQKWLTIDTKVTDQNGRITDFLPETIDEKDNYKGIYRLTFYTKPYFDARNINSFFPYIEVIFYLDTAKHYHVPITLSPFGYSTYRGS